jgi:hypothetical protein
LGASLLIEVVPMILTNDECCQGRHGLGDINETPKKTNKLIYGFAYMIHNMGT